MERFRSADAEIACQIMGTGAPVVLLHPFPVHHGFWDPVARELSARYRLLLPDLRGHGDSDAGEGPATMDKHAADLERLLDHAGVATAVCVGVSIGGYLLWEFWRRSRARVRALVVANTKAQADTGEGRVNRLHAADDVLKRGSEPFIESMLPKLLGRTTVQGRPDLVDAARRMMRKMSPQDIAQVQRGMAERPDSVETLRSIAVPTLVIAGDEDTLTPAGDAELIARNVRGSQLRVIPRGGHYCIFEQPQAGTQLIRQFLDALPAA
jgi:3-oxoadipate enol-lactonase